MPKKHLEEKFFFRKQAEKGKCIINYEDFAKVKSGNYLGLIINNTSDNFLVTYFEKRKPIKGNEKRQRVFLQHHRRTSNELYSLEKPVVVEYELPLKGKLRLNDFLNGQKNIYKVHNSEGLK